MHFTPISADDARDLVTLQRAGELYWHDSDITGRRALTRMLAPQMQISSERRDITEAQLRSWAADGELFERLNIEYEVTHYE